MWDTRLVSQILNKPTLKFFAIINDFCIDTRYLNPGDCFIAHDDTAHQFIDDARAKGASCVIAQARGDFCVDDPINALEELALYARKHSKAKRVAITGSAGKTSTKEFLYQVLKSHDVQVVASYKNYNNHLGVPLTLTQMRPNTKVAIIEAGSNHKGEIKHLNALIKPDIAIITNIGHAHIGHFDDNIDEIAKEKKDILKGVKHCILPYDSPYCGFLRDAATGQVTTFGEGTGADIQLISFEQNKIVIDVWGQRETYIVPLLYKHHVINVLAVIAACFALDVESYNFEKLCVPEGRGNIFSYALDPKRQVTILSDAYNASFESMKNMIESLSHMKIKGKKIAVLGDMGELGKDAATYHNQIAILAKKIDHIIVCGPLFSKAFDIPITPLERVWEKLQHIARNHDTIAFKGSFSSNVYSIVPAKKVL